MRDEQTVNFVLETSRWVGSNYQSFSEAFEDKIKLDKIVQVEFVSPLVEKTPKSAVPPERSELPAATSRNDPFFSATSRQVLNMFYIEQETSDFVDSKFYPTVHLYPSDLLLLVVGIWILWVKVLEGG